MSRQPFYGVPSELIQYDRWPASMRPEALAPDAVTIQPPVDQDTIRSISSGQKIPYLQGCLQNCWPRLVEESIASSQAWIDIAHIRLAARWLARLYGH